MYNNNTFNCTQMYYTKRRTNSNLQLYNIKKSLCLNQFNSNKISPKFNIKSDEYNNINNYSDITYFETKQKLDLMKFKIGKFKLFLDKSNCHFNDILQTKNYNIYEEEKKNYYYGYLKKRLTTKEKEEKGNISDIADDIIDAFGLDNNSRNEENDNMNTQILFKNMNFFNKSNNHFRSNSVYNKKK